MGGAIALSLTAMAPPSTAPQRLKSLLPDAVAQPLAGYARRSALVHRLRVRSQAKRCDVFLVSFPKTGRTWLRVLIGRSFKQHFDLPRRAMLRATAGRVTAPGMPRILATHDDATQDKPYTSVFGNKSAYRGHRVLFMVRDPRDVLISFYFQRTRRNQNPYKGSIGDFISEPNGGLETIISFYNAWAAQRHVPTAFHLVRYEDLRADTMTSLREVMNFVGAGDIADKTLAEAIDYASFERVQERERAGAAKNKALRAWNPNDPESFKARRGKVGGYVDYLTEEQIAEVERRLQRLDPLYGYQSRAT